MSVWIVVCNNVVHEVFDNHEAAVHHRNSLTMKWNLAHIIQKEVKSI